MELHEDDFEPQKAKILGIIVGGFLDDDYIEGLRQYFHRYHPISKPGKRNLANGLSQVYFKLQTPEIVDNMYSSQIMYKFQPCFDKMGILLAKLLPQREFAAIYFRKRELLECPYEFHKITDARNFLPEFQLKDYASKIRTVQNNTLYERKVKNEIINS